MDAERRMPRHFLAALAYRTQRVRPFHAVPADLAGYLSGVTPFRGTTALPMLPGPFPDAMTHAGQLALLRRLAASPVPPENFIMADIDPANLGPDQADPVEPDAEWPEAP